MDSSGEFSDLDVDELDVSFEYQNSDDDEKENKKKLKINVPEEEQKFIENHLEDDSTISTIAGQNFVATSTPIGSFENFLPNNDPSSSEYRDVSLQFAQEEEANENFMFNVVEGGDQDYFVVQSEGQTVEDGLHGEEDDQDDLRVDAEEERQTVTPMDQFLGKNNLKLVPLEVRKQIDTFLEGVPPHLKTNVNLKRNAETELEVPDYEEPKTFIFTIGNVLNKPEECQKHDILKLALSENQLKLILPADYFEKLKNGRFDFEGGEYEKLCIICKEQSSLVHEMCPSNCKRFAFDYILCPFLKGKGNQQCGKKFFCKQSWMDHLNRMSPGHRPRSHSYFCGSEIKNMVFAAIKAFRYRDYNFKDRCQAVYMERRKPSGEFKKKRIAVKKAEKGPKIELAKSSEDLINSQTPMPLVPLNILSPSK